MNEKLQRSPIYTEKIEKTRKSIRETDNQVDAREKAKLLRMGFILDSAVLAGELTTYIEEYPRASVRELMELAKSSDLVTHPQFFDKFTQELIFIRNQVARAKKQIKSEAGIHRCSEGSILFSWLSNNSTLSGSVYTDLNYPLAVILYVGDKDDFSKIDTRKNVGGFHDESQDYIRRVNKQGLESVDIFPVIVVSGLPSGRAFVDDTFSTTLHEKGHAENKAIQNTLRSYGHTTVWARSMPILDKSLTEANVAILVHNAQTFSVEYARANESWQILRDQALALAKDEILAEYKAEKGYTINHVNYMLKRRGLYDYFKRFGFVPGSDLYNEFWKDHEKVLNKAQAVIAKMGDSYVLPNIKLFYRVNLMRWVLAQIPLEDWDKQLEGTMFYQEIDEIKEADEIIAKIAAKYNWRSLDNQAVILAHKFQFKIESRRSAGVPLIPIIREFKEDLAQLEK